MTLPRAGKSEGIAMMGNVAEMLDYAKTRRMPFTFKLSRLGLVPIWIRLLRPDLQRRQKFVNIFPRHAALIGEPYAAAFLGRLKKSLADGARIIFHQSDRE